jgi:hypothetical protein
MQKQTHSHLGTRITIGTSMTLPIDHSFIKSIYNQGRLNSIIGPRRNRFSVLVCFGG